MKRSLFYLSTNCFLKLFFNIPLCHLYNMGKFISVQVIFCICAEAGVLYSHLNSWFILLNTSFVRSFKTDDSMRPFLLHYFYICDSCKVTLEEHFSKMDFLSTSINQIFCVVSFVPLNHSIFQ